MYDVLIALLDLLMMSKTSYLMLNPKTKFGGLPPFPPFTLI